MKEFYQYLKINCRKENTIKSYYNQVKKFLEYTNNEISQDLINEYLTYLIDSKKSNNSYNKFISSLKWYLKFIKKEFELPKIINSNSVIHEYITYEDLNKDIFCYLPDLFDNYLYIELILNVMFFTGIRRQELINLKRENINLKTGTIILKNTKGNEDRIVPLPKSLMSKIENYFQVEQEESSAFNITEGKINNIFKKIKQYLNLKNFHPHIMRHSCAMHLLKMGVPINTVQEILGHKKLETTQKSTKSDNKRVIEDFNKHIK